MAALYEEVRQVAPDETGSSGNEITHDGIALKEKVGNASQGVRTGRQDRLEPPLSPGRPPLQATHRVRDHDGQVWPPTATTLMKIASRFSLKKARPNKISKRNIAQPSCRMATHQ
jgi:hypothetical protein